MKYLFFIPSAIFAAILYFDTAGDSLWGGNHFVQATRGWFSPSEESVTITLVLLFGASLIFAFIVHRLPRYIVTLYVACTISFLASYYFFIAWAPSANFMATSGFVLTLLYGIGKYGTLMAVAVAALLALRKSARSEQMKIG